MTDRDHKIYVVNNFADGGNDRTRKLLELRTEVGQMTLVAPARGDCKPERNRDRWLIEPTPNPLGILRLLGLNGLKRTLERHLYFPSTHRLFTGRMVSALKAQLEHDLKEGYQVTLLTTAPPHALGLVGLALKKWAPQLRWIIDWQDLWSYDENYFLQTPTYRRSKLKRLEREMLEGADLNITTNEKARRVLIDQFDVPSAQSVAIHHHFDRRDFLSGRGSTPPASSGVRGDGTTNPIRIGFLGTLFKPPRVPGSDFVSALGQCRAQGINAELHIHGLLNDADQRQIAGQEGIHWHGQVTHEESVGRLAQYDLLLLLLEDLPNAKAVMSIKLPHYMAVGKPIVAIVPGDSAVAELVAQTGTGVVIPSDADWQQALQQFLSGYAASSLPKPSEERVEAFSWQRIAPQWRQALDMRAEPLASPKVEDSQQAAGAAG